MLASDYRAFLRSQMANPSVAALCQKVAGLSPQQAIDATKPTSDQSANAPLPNSTPVPSQSPSPDDALAAEKILQEECAAAPSPGPATPTPAITIVFVTPTPGLGR